MREHCRFAEIDDSFAEWNVAKIAILPVPYDMTSTWIKGADKGPFAIFEASQALELYDIETDSEVYKNGIYTCPPLDVDPVPEKMVKEVENKVQELLASEKFTILVGGEHSVSIGSVKAHILKHGDISVLQLDAHSDLRDEYKSSRYNHACTGARIKEMCSLIQVGVRSLDACEKSSIIPENMFYAKDIIAKDDLGKDVLKRLSDKVYVTIDLDVFDPSIMPSTGTPEPGGLDWYSAIGLLKEVAKNREVVGFDVAELCPNSNNKAPDFLAAKLIYKFLSYIYKYQG
ncbi:MAG: agmatinase [Candidatus Aadella gelida]|nr:agmatinase [Candidatus Aadella gelida]